MKTLHSWPCHVFIVVSLLIQREVEVGIVQSVVGEESHSLILIQRKSGDGERRMKS